MRGPALALVAVGRLRQGVEADLFAHYNARIRPPIAVTEVSEKDPRREAAAILAALPGGAFVVALDPRGRGLDSEGFAAALQGWGKVVFVIGGADGLDPAVRERADAVISLGKMTWPHLLVRGMLAEQIFRARAISAGPPYHRV